jgi:hypothetical protein
MILSHVLTSWAQEPNGAYTPQIWLDLMTGAGVLLDGDSITDQPTNQPAENIAPDPNAVVVECRLNPAAYAWVEANQPGAILWSEDEQQKK